MPLVSTHGLIHSMEDNDVDEKDDAVELRGGHRGSRRRRRPPPVRNRRHRRRCPWTVALAAGLIAAVIIIAGVAALAMRRQVLELSPQPQPPPPRPAEQQRLPAGAACSRISVRNVWRRALPRLGIGGPLRLLDVNLDGVPDIILTFGQDSDRLTPMGADCSVESTPASACAGGIAALDGATGRIVWRSRLEQRPLAIGCEADLNKDGRPDCVVGGRGGLMSAHNGVTGARLWRSEVTRGRKTYFTGQPIGDVDDDGVPDFVQTRGGGGGSEEADYGFDDAELKDLPPKGELLLVSGATGAETAWQYVPDRRPLQLSPQIVTLPDGPAFGNGGGGGGDSRRILFSTGGDFDEASSQGGAAFLLRLKTFLMSGETAKAVPVLYGGLHKGSLGGPATLADLDSDGRPELILPLLNGSVAAAGVAYLLGRGSPVWRADLPPVGTSEIRWAPVPGFYNADRVPDFFVQYSVGEGYPVYSQQRFVVLDGTTGRVIDELPRAEAAVGISGTLGSPLTVAFEGQGHDLFLHWRLDCGRQKSADSHGWLPCSRSFNASSHARLMLAGRHIPGPGITVYDGGAEKDSPSDRPRSVTGTLAPPSPPAGGVHRGFHSNSIDAVFAVGSTIEDDNGDWTKSTSPGLRCLDSFLGRQAERFRPTSKYFGMSARRYRNLALRRCAENLRKTEPAFTTADGRIGSSKSGFKAAWFARQFKQLVVYRRRITCHCESESGGRRQCGRILPFGQQRWTAYMGNRADGYLRNAP